MAACWAFSFLFIFPKPHPLLRPYSLVLSLKVCWFLNLQSCLYILSRTWLTIIETSATMAVTSISLPFDCILPSSSGSSVKKPIKSVSKPCFGCDCGDEECDCCICTVMWGCHFVSISIWSSGISVMHGLSTKGVQTRKPHGEVQDPDPRGLGLHLIFISRFWWSGTHAIPRHQSIIVHSVLTFYMSSVIIYAGHILYTTNWYTSIGTHLHTYICRYLVNQVYNPDINCLRHQDESAAILSAAFGGSHLLSLISQPPPPPLGEIQCILHLIHLMLPKISRGHGLLVPVIPVIKER